MDPPSTMDSKKDATDPPSSPMKVDKEESPSKRDPSPTASITNTTNTTNTTNNNNNEDHDDDEAAADPKFQPKQRVYAKDASSGLWYEAVVRRSLFGVNNNKQVQIGLVCNESEIADILAQSANEPIWHYFVHYSKWAVNWDRWVSEEDILESNEESKKIADRYVQEHKELQKELKKTKGRKSDGAAFLKEWRQRMDRMEEDMKKEEEEAKKLQDSNEKGSLQTSQSGRAVKTGETAAETPVVAPAPLPPKPKPKKKKKQSSSSEKVWDKSALEREYKLKLRGLEAKRTSQDQHKMALPFSLKKVMVEAWEIITQCQMVPNLPASVTVRQVLDKYLKSKVDLMAASSTTATTTSAPVLETAAANGAKDTQDTTEVSANDKGASDTADDAEAAANKEKIEKKKQEWIDMVEGIAMFFDEALAFRLLYSQELPQYKVVESTFVVPIVDATVKDERADEIVKGDNSDGDKDESMPDVPGVKAEADDDAKTDIELVKNESAHADTKQAPTEELAKNSTGEDAPVEGRENGKSSKPTNPRKSKGSTEDGTRPMLPCEVYGSEHLLRLCLKIPELLSEQQPKISKGDEIETQALKAYENESKQILAKVNDLIRFLHKHQSTMFADSYRKMNEAELREEQKWSRYIERKRKRNLEEKQGASALGGIKEEACALGGNKEEVSAPTSSICEEKADAEAPANTKLQKVA